MEVHEREDVVSCESFTSVCEGVIGLCMGFHEGIHELRRLSSGSHRNEEVRHHVDVDVAFVRG